MSATPLDVCKEFWRVMQVTKRAISAIAEEHHLTLQQAIVLLTLHDNGVIGMGAVACHMHCDASNVTGLIDRLVALGYVVRRELPEDRRTKLLELTPSGRAFVAEVLQAVPQQAGFTQLNSEECDTFMHLLGRLSV